MTAWTNCSEKPFFCTSLRPLYLYVVYVPLLPIYTYDEYSVHVYTCMYAQIEQGALGGDFEGLDCSVHCAPMKQESGPEQTAAQPPSC